MMVQLLSLLYSYVANYFCVLYAVQCHIYIPFNNGIARVNKDKSFVTFQCVSGFRLVGSSSATCREDGTWSSPPPTCTSKCNV